jgi:hypothetical protein
MKSDNLQEEFAGVVRWIESLPALCSSGRLQSETQEEMDALLPSHRDATQSVLRPQGGAFRGEL